MDSSNNKNAELERQESKVKGINAFVLLFIVIAVMTVLTYSLTSGSI